MSGNQNRTESGILQAYRWIRFILLPLIFLAFIVSAYQLFRIYAEHREGEEIYRAVSEQYSAPNPTAESVTNAEAVDETVRTETSSIGETLQPVGTLTTSQESHTEQPSETPEPQRAPVTIDFAGLKEMNGECVGWIHIPDATVDYPVMQGENNSKYLYMLPDGTENKNGSIFMDYRNDPELTDRNTIFYGHRLESGGMFTPLLLYKERAFFNRHRTAYYLTPDGDYRLDVIACATVPSSGETYDMYDDPEELQKYLKEVTNKAHIAAEYDLNSIDRIITLSTCTGKSATRFIVICVPVKLG